MEIPEEIIVPWKVKVSEQARLLLENLKGEISIRELANWIANESDHGEIGGAHIIQFLQERKKRK